MRTRLIGSALASAMLGAVLAAPAPQAHAADDQPCDSTSAETANEALGTSLPLQDMAIDRVHRLATGRGVKVAVLDTGVAANGYLPNVSGAGSVKAGHGTEVAGLIGGAERDGHATGLAPDAQIVSFRTGDVDQSQTDSSQQDIKPISEQNVVKALGQVATGGFQVVNLSFTLPDTPALRDAVQRVVEAGVVVVAATGNRPSDESQPDYAELKTYRAKEDVVRYPAGYPGVVGVNVAEPAYDGTNASQWALASSATDVSAQSAGAVTTSFGDQTCILAGSWTSYAAAMVSGLAALLRERDPDDTPQQTIARIEETADGSASDKGLFSGAGAIQPLEALTRDLKLTKQGRVLEAGTYAQDDGRLTAPDPVTDEFAGARRSFIWWGLLAGGALLLASIARPLLRRSRGD